MPAPGTREEKGNFVKETKQKTGLYLLSALVTLGLLLALLGTGTGSASAASSSGMQLMDRFDQNLNNQLSTLLEGVVTISRSYQLSDRDLVAPRPNPERYGQAGSPEEMEDILETGMGLLGLDSMLFTTQTPIKEGTDVRYYLDETIFAVTWKQVVEDCTYTFSEVKVAHPSQFRRFLSEGQYGSGVVHTTTEMSQVVNAVVASSGDYYGYRTIGLVVNDGQVYRDRGHFLDTCFIDDQGDLLFSCAGEITDKETAQAYVEAHNVRFSLSFGPVMILDGEFRVPDTYNSGEINDNYPRAALCQMGKCHYVVVAANTEEPNYTLHSVAQFAKNLQAMGIHTAYALDGGQTAAIVMENELINTVSYGSQREISDIIYFATAIPET